MQPTSQYATLVGARSWLKKGLGWSMLAKWAAWPPSCISVTSADFPDPTALGVASDVSWAVEGTQLPSGRRQAGWGQWQKPERTHTSLRVGRIGGCGQFRV